MVVGAGVGMVVGEGVGMGVGEGVAASVGAVVGDGVTTGALQATSNRTPASTARVAREEAWNQAGPINPTTRQ